MHTLKHINNRYVLFFYSIHQIKLSSKLSKLNIWIHECKRSTIYYIKLWTSFDSNKMTYHIVHVLFDY